jgi:hypothetical protein
VLAESFLERNGTAFQILATAVALALSALGGWWLRSRNKQSKTFDYELLSDVPILSHRPDDAQLKVTYLDSELENPRVVRVRFKNAGTEVIRPAEVLTPYRLGVGSAWLVSCTMVEQSAANLASFVASAGPCTHGVDLTLNTLNPGDEFTLQMILDSEAPADLVLSGRMENESRPSRNMAEVRLSQERSKALWKLLGGIALGAAALAITWMAREWRFAPILGGAGFTAASMLVVGALTDMTSRRVQANGDWLYIPRR